MHTRSFLMLLLLLYLGCEKPSSQARPDAWGGVVDLAATLDLATIRDLSVVRPDLTCVPDCQGKECGDDGCGGFCGQCPAPKRCQANQVCECRPQCTGQACGDDGCGGSCGSCPAGKFCDDIPGNRIACGRCLDNFDLKIACDCDCRCSDGGRAWGFCNYAQMSCSGCRTYCSNACASFTPKQTVIAICGTCTG